MNIYTVNSPDDTASLCVIRDTETPVLESTYVQVAFKPRD